MDLNRGFSWLLCELVFSVTKLVRLSLRFQKKVYQSLVFFFHIFYLSLKSLRLFILLDLIPSPFLPVFLALPISIPPCPSSLNLPSLCLFSSPCPCFFGFPCPSSGLLDLSISIPYLHLQLLDLCPQSPQLELVLRERALAYLLGQVDEAGTSPLSQLVKH